jgi:hypothetical protein
LRKSNVTTPAIVHGLLVPESFSSLSFLTSHGIKLTNKAFHDWSWPHGTLDLLGG